MKILDIVAIVLIIAGIGVMMRDPSSGHEIVLLAGLFMLYVVKPKGYDERTVQIKAGSAYYALILGYGIKLLSSNLYSHKIIPVQLTEINHFLILVFAIALVLYYGILYFTAR